MTTTYCTRQALASMLSEPALLSLIDDNADGVESATESQFVTDAIVRAAVKLNSHIGRQYVLSELASNDWMKWANATLAVVLLYRRRGNPVPESFVADAKEIEDMAVDVGWGRKSLPEQAPSFDHSAAVTNFRPEIGRRYSPIRVDRQESTGADPVGDRKRNIAGGPILY